MSDNPLSYAEAYARATQWAAFMQAFSTMADTLGAVAQAENQLTETQAAIVKAQGELGGIQSQLLAAEAKRAGLLLDAQNTLADAQAKAASLVNGAQTKADGILAEAKTQAADLVIQGQAALGIATANTQEQQAKYESIKSACDDAVKQMNDARNYLAALKGA